MVERRRRETKEIPMDAWRREVPKGKRGHGEKVPERTRRKKRIVLGHSRGQSLKNAGLLGS
jgi:hypothetical protein